MCNEFGITLESLRARLGFSTFAFPAHSLVREQEIAAIRKAGICRIELCGLHGVSHFDYRNPDYLEELKRACTGQGVTIVSVHAPCPDLVDRNESRRADAVADIISAGRAAVELGAKILVVHFGICERSEKSVHEVLDGLEGSGLTVTIENLPDIPDLKDYIRFVERIDRDSFGLTVDIGHTIDEDGDYPFSEKSRARKTLAQCGSHVAHLHLHDVRLHSEYGWMDHFPPFSGVVLWDEVFKALADIGYSGEYMFEPASSVMWKDEKTDWASLDDAIVSTAAFPEKLSQRFLNEFCEGV